MWASSHQTLGDTLDEYYGLNYEDIVAGIPCRFRYRTVENQDFGLTAEEVCCLLCVINLICVINPLPHP